MNNADRKAYVKALRAVVTESIRESDPIRLLAMGAPADEYDSEIGTILPRLREAASVEEVRTVLHEEFVRWFDADLAGPPEAFEGAAHRIWAFLANQQRPLDK